MTEPQPPAPSSEAALERAEEAIEDARRAAGELHDGGGLVPPDEAQGVQPPG